MSGIPAWCRVGSKIACVYDGHPTDRLRHETLPTKGEVYTIREISTKWGDGDVGVRVVEIVNAPADYLDGVHECWFSLTRFRPLVTEQDDLEAHFNQFLKQDHRERVVAVHAREGHQ